MILKVFFYLLSGMLVIATALPFIRKDHWTFRVFEFPRVQKLFLTVVAIITGVRVAHDLWHYLMVGVLVLIALYLISLIFPFTPLSRKTVASASKSSRHLTLLISNVYQDNTNFHKLKKHIENIKPDMLLLVETDEKWREALQDCTRDYAHRVEHPRDNTYGLLFYSNFEVLSHEIRFLIDKEYPSIKARIKLPWGTTTTFYGVHPPPPSPTENSYSTERDHELWIIAKEVERQKGSVLVAGDLNDVAWSFTTERFLDISGLRDPRRGRGIFATFNADNVLMRWPLDHIFCSEDFALVKMKRLKHISSDHFPVLVKLAPSSGSRQR